MKHPKPITLTSEAQFPHFTIAMATTEWNETGTWRYMRPHYVERIPSCQAACPTSNNIEGWIKLFEQGNVASAFELATVENPFPSLMGRVCFHPCMDGCNRRELDSCVNINMLERALGDAARKLPFAKNTLPSSGKKVAVIGSGPAGLACAYHLTRLGHKVRVFERAKSAGGMLRYGIPSYRLPKDELDAEINRLKGLGIEFVLGKDVSTNAIQEQMSRDYAAVFVAIGAQKSRAMGLADENTGGIMSGLELLRRVADSNPPILGRNVIVVGGGNTAIDTARCAKRLGAEVMIAYRRSRAEMPAFEEETKQAEEEGIKIEVLVSPKRIILENDKLKGIECQKMKLGEPDASGRRAPVSIEGQLATFNAETIFTAIGEEVEGGTIESKIGGRTQWQNVFAGGDCIEAPRTVVDALSAGKLGAIAIDCNLNGTNFDEIFEKIRIAGTNFALISRYLGLKNVKGNTPSPDVTYQNKVVKFSDLNPIYFTKSEMNAYPVLETSKRPIGNSFNEILQPPSESACSNELARCFHCGRCNECDNCYIYCPDTAILKKESGFEIDYHFCKGCGICPHECPRCALEMIEEPMEI